MWEGFFTGYLNCGLNCREKNEEIISRNSLPHYKRATSFTNKREAAWLHFLPNLSRYRRMSESVQHDEQGSSLHDRWCLRYDEQCPSLHAEGLKNNHYPRQYWSFGVCIGDSFLSTMPKLHLHVHRYVFVCVSMPTCKVLSRTLSVIIARCVTCI